MVGEGMEKKDSMVPHDERNLRVDLEGDYGKL